MHSRLLQRADCRCVIALPALRLADADQKIAAPLGVFVERRQHFLILGDRFVVASGATAVLPNSTRTSTRFGFLSASGAQRLQRQIGLTLRHGGFHHTHQAARVLPGFNW
jgi:hypothetical protein